MRSLGPAPPHTPGSVAGPVITLQADLGRRARTATLAPELVHWTRGLHSPSAAPFESWERAEEERVVRAIAADRLSEVAR